MYIPKRYGESQVTSCPFCGKQSTAKNKQGVLVCGSHKDTDLEDIKCLCGSWLELRTGKWGPYFNCIKCGNINFKKGLEMRANVKIVAHQTQKKEEVKEVAKEKSKDLPKETTVTAEDIELYWT